MTAVLAQAAAAFGEGRLDESVDLGERAVALALAAHDPDSR